MGHVHVARETARSRSRQPARAATAARADAVAEQRAVRLAVEGGGHGHLVHRAPARAAAACAGIGAVENTNLRARCSSKSTNSFEPQI